MSVTSLPNAESKMGSRLLLYAAAVFLGAALLAPVLYHVIHIWWPVPFHRCLHRALLIAAVGGLPILAPLRLSWRRWKDWGLGLEVGWKRDLMLGLAAGAVSLLLVAGVQLAVGARDWSLQTLNASWLGAVLLAVILVPLIEEPLFRGGLQPLCIRWKGPLLGIFLPAIVFATVHFFKAPRLSGAESVEWFSGFQALGNGFIGLTDWSRVGPGWVTLFLAGMALGLASWRRGNIWGAMGLHAGWILALKVTSGFTRAVPASWPIGGELLASGLSWGVLVVLIVLIWRNVQKIS